MFYCRHHPDCAQSANYFRFLHLHRLLLSVPRPVTTCAVSENQDLSFLTPARDRILRRQLDKRDKTSGQLQKKVKLLQQIVRWSRQKRSKIKDLDTLKQEKLIDQDIRCLLEMSFSRMSLALIINENSNMDRRFDRLYSAEIPEFTSAEHLLSPKAYKFAHYPINQLCDESKHFCDLDGHDGSAFDMHVPKNLRPRDWNTRRKQYIVGTKGAIPVQETRLLEILFFLTFKLLFSDILHFSTAYVRFHCWSTCPFLFSECILDS